MNTAEIKKHDDMFKAEKLAIGYCKCYGHKEGSKAYEIATAAFANGYKFDKTEIKKQAISEFIDAWSKEYSQRYSVTKSKTIGEFGAEYLKGLKS